MNKWIASLNQREQLSLLALALALGLYLLYVVIWSPVVQKRNELTLRNENISASLQRVDAMVSEILLLRKSDPGSSHRRNLTSLINRSTARMNLQVSRLQPNSRGELQVRLENASFDDIISWLYDMEFAQGLLVREVSITRSGGAGRVNASVRLAQGA